LVNARAAKRRSGELSLGYFQENALIQRQIHNRLTQPGILLEDNAQHITLAETSIGTTPLPFHWNAL
jgi:hypothetical protein